MRRVKVHHVNGSADRETSEKNGQTFIASAVQKAINATAIKVMMRRRFMGDAKSLPPDHAAARKIEQEIKRPTKNRKPGL